MPFTDETDNKQKEILIFIFWLTPHSCIVKKVLKSSFSCPFYACGFKKKLVSPCVTMYFFCSSLSKWWNLCSRVVKKLIYLWSDMAWSPSLCAIGWLLSLELSAFFWDTEPIFEQTQADLTQVLRTWSIQLCEYLELDFVPPIFGPLKIRSNGLSLVTSRLSWTLAFFIAWWPEIEWHVN